jgi:predicted membrane protein
MENNQNPIKHNNGSNIIGGLILICIGVALVMRKMDFPFPNWLFTWPMILILVGFYSGVKHNFRNNSWIILSGIGVFFLLDRYVLDVSIATFFWPILIIAAGILFILRPSGMKENNWGFNTGKSQTGNWQAYGSSTSTDNNDFLNIQSVFSGVQRSVLSKNFQGGKVSCVFGGAEIDLTQADISGSVTLKLEAVFGGIKLIVPAHWQVINEIDGIFHGVDDKRRAPAGAYNDVSKTLVLKGSAVFGGIEIRSY